MSTGLQAANARDHLSAAAHSSGSLWAETGSGACLGLKDTQNQRQRHRLHYVWPHQHTAGHRLPGGPCRVARGTTEDTQAAQVCEDLSWPKPCTRPTAVIPLVLATGPRSRGANWAPGAAGRPWQRGRINEAAVLASPQATRKIKEATRPSTSWSQSRVVSSSQEQH